LAGRVFADLSWLERLDHAVLFGHAADPFVALDAHRSTFECFEHFKGPHKALWRQPIETKGWGADGKNPPPVTT
jgi:hypothetical protein